MFNPVPPQQPDPPRQRAPREPFEPIDNDRFDIRRRDSGEGDLTGVDWLLCIFLWPVAFIIGIVRLIQGKPNAGKMVAISLVFAVILTLLRAAASLR